MLMFALVLLVELATHSSMALPKVKMDEDHTDQDRVVSIAGEDDISEMGPGQLTFRRHPIIEGRIVDEDGTKRIFILAVSVSICVVSDQPQHLTFLKFLKTFIPFDKILKIDIRF